MKKDLALNNLIGRIKKEKDEKEELLNRLSDFENISFSDKLFLLKDCGVDMRNKKLIEALIEENIISSALRGDYEVKINNIVFSYKDFEILIPLYKTKTIIIKDLKTIRKPERRVVVSNETLYLSYFEYQENKDWKSFHKYLEVKFPYIRKFFRPIFYFYNKEEYQEREKAFKEEYDKSKERNEESYKKKLKEYRQREKDKKEFLEEIKEDLDYFLKSGWDVKYINFKEEGIDE